ncbi:LysR family transcriptional regulator [uncultured Lactobacillus sp.]|uniref:LysR family transcriptional regulator n=1 Tax=uncultured Lactobacillus sp. TaxID=153152 RepID=UPI002637D300|nr:LysR family transcriptional regulator [uncultured Lactobacillus sp.]
MEIKDLNYFKKLVETKSYILTARHFNVTQPAISAMVKRLEKEIGTKLVKQTNSRAQLVITPAGLVTYQQTKKILQLEKSILIEAKRANENNFRLGYSELAGRSWLPTVITKLNQGHLLASIETYQENSHYLIKHLKEGRYDAIVFSRLGDEKMNDIKITDFAKYQYELIVSKNSKLATKSEIDLFSLRNIPLIMRHQRFLSRIALERIMTRTGFKPKKTLIVDSIDATAQLISQGMGVGYLMNNAISHLPNVTAVPLIPSQQINCYSSLAIRNDFIPNDIQQKCLDILLDR